MNYINLPVIYSNGWICTNNKETTDDKVLYSTLSFCCKTFNCVEAIINCLGYFVGTSARHEIDSIRRK